MEFKDHVMTALNIPASFMDFGKSFQTQHISYIKQNKNIYFNNKYIFDNTYRSYRKSVINNKKQIMV